MTRGIVRAKTPPVCPPVCPSVYVRQYTYAAYVRIQRPLAPIVVVYTVVDKKNREKAFATANAFLRENRSGTVAAGTRDGSARRRCVPRGRARRREETRNAAWIFP